MKTLKAKCAFLLLVSIFFAVGFLSPQTVSAAAAPGITTQPQSQTLLAGSNAIFSVVASGNPPLSYQWSLNGTNLANSTHIAGAANATLTVSNLVPADAGNYQVVVSNSHGTATSSNAALTVLFPPVITEQPQSLTTNGGSTVTLSATVSGSEPLLYQWQFDGANLTGATNANLTLNNVLDSQSGTYDLVVSNTWGVASSSNATLTVVPWVNPSIAPNPIIAGDGQLLIFAINAGGFSPNATYQWYQNGNSLGDFWLFTTVTEVAEWRDPPVSVAGNYYIVANDSLTTVTSSIVTLTVLVPATITTPPTDQSVAVSNNVVFAAGVIGDAPLSYQWYFQGTPLSDGGHISGSTTATLDIANVQTNDAGSYQLVVTNIYGSASATAALTVGIPPAITSQPANQAVSLASNVTFMAAATGTTPLNYQWYFNGTPLTDGGNINGSTTTNLSISNVQTNDAGSYQLVAANNYGTATSSLVSLDVWIPVGITTQPGNQASLLGANATFSVAAAGTAPLSYQWQFNGVNLDGATNPVLNLSDLQAAQAGFYCVLVSNVAGSLLSSNATLTVILPPPGVPLITGFSPNIAIPGASVSIQGTNFNPIAAGNIVYFGAVRAAVNAATPTNLGVTVPVGATYAPITVTVNGLTASAFAPFLPTYLGGGSGIIAANFGSRQTLATPTGPNQVVIADLDGDGKPDLIISDDYSHSISIYRNISSGGTLTPASFAPRIDLPAGAGTYSPFNIAVADVDGDGKLDIIATEYGDNVVSVYQNLSTPGNLSSNSFAPRVDFPTGLQPQGITVRDLDGDGKPDILTANSGDGTVSILRNTSVTGSVTTNSFAPRVDLLVGVSCDYVAVGDLNGDGKPDLVTANNNGTISIFQNGIVSPGAITTNLFSARIDLAVPTGAVKVMIVDIDGDNRPDLTITSYLPQTFSVIQNLSQGGDLSSNSFGPRIDYAMDGRGHTIAVGDLDGDGKPDLIVDTELNSLLSLFRNVSTPGTLTFSSLATQVELATGYNAWGSAVGDLDGDGRPDIVFANSYDNNISFYQNMSPFGGPPRILASPTNQSAVLSTTAQLSGNVVGQVPLEYQWFFNGTNLVDGGRIGGSATGLLAISNAQPSDAGNYYFVVTNSLGSATSAVAGLTILIPPQFTEQPSNQWVSLSSNVLFSAEVNGSALFVYQWFFNGNPLVDNGHVSGSATTNLAIVNLQLPDAGNYTLVVTNPGGMATSSVAVLSIANPLITSQPQSQSALGGATVTFSVGVTGQPPLAFQWQFNGVNLVGATNNPLVISNVQVAQSGSYSLVVTNAYGQAASSNANLTIMAFTITTQPTNAVAWVNGSASFRVNVTGTGPFAYLWLFNGYDFGGPNSNVLVLTNLQSSQFGTYSVIVSNPFGYQTSSNANLFVSQVAVWGNFYGETNLPANLTNVVAVSGGQLSTMDCLALNSNGTAVTWPSSPPTNVTAALTNLIAISCGGEVSDLGLRPDGSVVSWYLKPPAPVAGLTNIAAIAADGAVYLALTANGTLKTPATPGPPPAATNVVAIALREGHYLALKADGTVIAWGENNYGQATIPVGLSNVIAIAASAYHSLALKSDGTVQGWGYNAYGQAVAPPGLSNVVAIAAGYYHSLALKRDGTVVAWGLGVQGQTRVPPGLTNVVAIAAGAYHSMALIGNGPPLTSLPLINPALGTNGFSLSSPSQSGRVYVLQYMNSISGGNWNPLPLVPGNGGSLLLADPSATNSQRFYRVQQW